MLRVRKEHLGFTLIELLVVIAVIGFLSSVVIVTANKARRNSQLTRLVADARQITTAIELRRDMTSKTMLEMTVQSCTVCDFQPYSTPMKDDPAAIGQNRAAWAALGFNEPPMDPWGNPYTTDANERENPLNPCQYWDLVISAGPNGKLDGTPASPPGASPPGPVYLVADDEDYYFTVPFFTC
jgi:prepilin-type N-terminal cleavage/methylation domain-containing protein